MAKGRMINSVIAFDAKVHRLSCDTSRLAFTWLITFADAEGRTYGDPAIVRSMIFPRRTDVTIEAMIEYMTEWQREGLIIWYEAAGDTWIQFSNFEKNQVGLRKDREAPSNIPAPSVRSKSGVSPEQLPVKRKEKKRKEEKENLPAFPFDEYNQWQEHEDDMPPAERIMRNSCGVLGGGVTDQFPVVDELVRVHGEECTQEAMTKCYQHWIKTKSPKTGRTYSATNYKGIVDWAVQLLNTKSEPWVNLEDIPKEKTYEEKLAEEGYQ